MSTFYPELRVAAVVAALACAIRPADAHDPLDEQITALTTRLALTPDDVSLLLRRADVYRQAGRWTEGLADLTRARHTNGTLDRIDLLQAALLDDAGAPQLALLFVGRYLDVHPDHGAAWQQAANLLAKQMRSRDALDVYDYALTRLTTPKPELFLERAAVCRDLDPPDLDRAITGLEEGLVTLGPIVTLELELIELELARGQIEAALCHIDRRLDRARRPERWLVYRGDVLAEAFRFDEARAAYTAAVRAIESLPARHRATPATRALVRRIEAGRVFIGQ